jgi:2-phospho-L-lactate transferase/gluconeogenesis factor (CofD/UPF0052 family)
MERNWKVSRVELLEGGMHFGFVLYDRQGLPCLSIGFVDEAKASAARAKVLEALKEADEVLGR